MTENYRLTEGILAAEVPSETELRNAVNKVLSSQKRSTYTNGPSSRYQKSLSALRQCTGAVFPTLPCVKFIIIPSMSEAA